MSYTNSPSGTLYAGIGGPPPRPSATLDVGSTPVAAVAFSVSQDYTYVSTNPSVTFGGTATMDLIDSGGDAILEITVDAGNNANPGMAPGVIGCPGNLVSGSRTFSVAVPNPASNGSFVSGILTAHGTVRLYQVVEDDDIFTIPQTNLAALVTLVSAAGTTVISHAGVPGVSSSATIGIQQIESRVDIGTLAYNQAISPVDVSETITLNPIADIAYDSTTNSPVLFGISGTNTGAVQMQNLMIVVDENNEQINTRNGVYQTISATLGNGDSFLPGSIWGATIAPQATPTSEPRVTGLGTHTIRVVDADWGVYSNLVTFNVVDASGGGGGGGGGSGPLSPGNIIRVSGGIGIVTEYIPASSGGSHDSSTGGGYGGPPTPAELICDMWVQPPALVPNAPSQMIFPQDAEAWSLSAPVSVAGGLDHLTGNTVAIVADGNVLPPQEVVDGCVTLPTPATYILAGMVFTAQVQTLRLDADGAGVIQGRRKSIAAVTLRTMETRGLAIGPDFTHMDEVKQRSTERAHQATQFTLSAGWTDPPYPGGPISPIPPDFKDLRTILEATYNENGFVCVQQNYPMPVTLLAEIPESNVGDT